MAIELLTTKQAAKRLGLSARSVRLLVGAGKLPVHRFGPKDGMVRFDPEELDEFLNEAREGRAAESANPESRDSWSQGTGRADNPASGRGSSGS
jgi:excisionase family DNA binding protein